MKVQVTPKGENTVLLTISAAAAELEPIRVHTLGHFVHDVKIPGFREGKAPLELVEKHIDQQRFMNEFMEHAVNDLYNQAVVQEKLRVVAPPQIEVKKFVPFTTLEFTAEALIVKITKLADYKTIKQTKEAVSVTAKDIDAVINDLRQRAAQRTETKEAAKNGNEVVIDFSGKDAKGDPVPGSEGKDFPLMLGSNQFIPGFEDNLIGLKAGDKKDFTIAFPKDYGVKSLQGQKVTFSVEVKSVNVLYETAEDDAFAAKVSPFKTIAELKADIKKQLLSERESQANRLLESQIVDEIVQKSQVSLPAQLVEEQVMRMEEDEKRNLVARGTTWEEHLKQEGLTETTHRDRHRPDAERNIKAGVLLGEISELEKVSVTPEELSIRTQILKGQSPDPAMQAEMDKPEIQRDLRARMLTEKTMAKLVDYATK